MKIIFKKHGNFILYGILPLLFLVLTIGFIEFSPRLTQSAGQACSNDEACDPPSNSMGENEFCNDDTGKCQTPNVGCVTGEVDQDFDTCVCVDDSGQVVGDCVVCTGEDDFFNTATGTCIAIADFCLSGGGGALAGEGNFAPDCGCSLNPSAPTVPGKTAGLSALAIAFIWAMYGLRKSVK